MVGVGETVGVAESGAVPHDLKQVLPKGPTHNRAPRSPVGPSPAGLAPKLRLAVRSRHVVQPHGFPHGPTHRSPDRLADGRF